MPDYFRRLVPDPAALDEVGLQYHIDHPLGRHVRHDPESRRFAHLASGRQLVAVTHTRHIDILDQGQVGSCTGNACTGGLGTSPDYEALPAKHPVLDEQEALVLYSAAEIIDGGTGYLNGGEDEGSSGLSVAKAAKTAGFISGYTHALSLSDALDALQDGPVLWGTNWLTGMDNVSAAGLIKYTGPSRGGHELVLRSFDPATGLVGGDNSWGTSWGFRGSFFITATDLGKSLADQGDITILVPLSQPAPVPTPTPVPPTPTPAPVPVPDPGAASFLVSAAVNARITRTAARDRMTPAQWVEQHFEHYFNLPPS